MKFYSLIVATILTGFTSLIQAQSFFDVEIGSFFNYRKCPPKIICNSCTGDTPLNFGNGIINFSNVDAVCYLLRVPRIDESRAMGSFILVFPYDELPEYVEKRALAITTIGRNIERIEFTVSDNRITLAALRKKLGKPVAENIHSAAWKAKGSEVLFSSSRALNIVTVESEKWLQYQKDANKKIPQKNPKSM